MGSVSKHVDPNLLFLIPLGIFCYQKGVKLSLSNLKIDEMNTLRPQMESLLKYYGPELEDLSEFVDNAAVGIHLVDKEGHFLWANKKELELTGYTLEEYQDLTLTDLIMGEKSVKEIRAVLGKEGEIIDYPTKLRCKNGDIRFATLTSNVFLKDNEVVHTRCFIRDISDQIRLEEEKMQAQQKLSHSEARYRSVVESQIDLICRLKPNLQITFVNNSYANFFGKEITDLLDLNLLDLLNKGNKTKVKDHFESLKNKNSKQRIEYQIPNDKGELRWQQWSTQALYDRNNNVVEFQAVGRDITEIKTIEAELKQHKEKLEELVEDRTSELNNAYQKLKRSEEKLRVQKSLVDEKNSTLNHLIKNHEQQIKQVQKHVMNNVEKILQPLIDLIKTKVDEEPRDLLDLMKTSLGEITSPFIEKTNAFEKDLSMREIEIANMVKEGWPSKKISEQLGMSFKTVERHRNNIRRKLGVTKKGVNLSKFLKELN